MVISQQPSALVGDSPDEHALFRSSSTKVYGLADAHLSWILVPKPSLLT